MVVWCTRNVCQEGSSSIWYTTWMRIQNSAMKDYNRSFRITCNKSAVSAQEQRIALHKMINKDS